ncbi:glycoside hydrolase family 127 protein [Xanthomonas translucens]|uniref:glycoside hydrolase family 127 protein n=1 Tax=Xanthomonas campestris pv. translucens TaxID=343 RepID=UPI001F47FA45|nr:glycoside hydrolase family 127 protein [Xanthomonas translucens]UKE49514.1 glycoside hydrolase family 127 protein [Xanthomonas translucens]
MNARSGHVHSAHCAHTASADAEVAALDPSRRRFLQWSALAVAAGLLRFPLDAAASSAGAVQALPLKQVTLKPSLFLDSLQTNRRYLLELEPDRLLHNFLQYAGLPPKGEVYGGWEGDTIAGHTLGHYLSALAKMHAQTRDAALRQRIDYIVAELARAQAKDPDGYVGGLTRKNDKGAIDNGKLVFEEVRRGIIKGSKFNLNGSWSPLYTVHKLFAGLLDAHELAGNAQALQVLLPLAGYLGGVFDALDHAQMQALLDTEFGGLNESYIELGARTGDPRWIALGKRLRHEKVIDPAAAGRDELPHIHANTQVPKFIGEARQFEVAGDADAAAAARFFWETVTGHYSYVIGGNADREYFQEPDTIAAFLTEQTCEHCNSYNMLKLTRHLYQWTPQARYFDYYERTLHNHTMAAQHPATGMFTYMTPMIGGGERGFSDKFDSFWCCVGSGMEAHAQFGDSIYWQDAASLYVNLYIPSTLDWPERDLALELDSGVPDNGKVRLQLRRAGARTPRRLLLRLPAWCQGGYTLRLNGKAQRGTAADGYLALERRWRSGDVIELDLAMPLRLEHAAGDADTVVVMRGPLALAADLGPVAEPYDAPDPALVAAADPLAGFAELPQPGHFLAAATQPPGLTFVPFYAQYERRSALYFKRLAPAQWAQEAARRARQQAERAALQATAVDMIQFGDEASEQAHTLRSDTSFGGAYRRKQCRDVRGKGFVEFQMKGSAQPLALRLRFWGSDKGRFNILIDGKLAVEVQVDRSQVIDFVDRDYALPPALTRAAQLTFRIEPQHGDTAGPLFGGWLIPAASA